MFEIGSKSSVRKELLKKRDAIPPEVRRAKDRLIHERLAALDEFRNADLIFFFASFRSEVDTIMLIKETLIDGRRVVLPKVEEEQGMLFLHEIKSIEELKKGYMGIPEPSAEAEERMMDINDVDVVIIPGAGFDITGNRIGYGAGYYDKLLSGLKKDIPVIAPAYEEQVVDLIPAEPHDRKVHLIVTDRRVIRCA
ncbi:MAG: 5-formyltetrahydrofolate cyclo-ligase [Nitrospirota bacterium]